MLQCNFSDTKPYVFLNCEKWTFSDLTCRLANANADTDFEYSICAFIAVMPYRATLNYLNMNGWITSRVNLESQKFRKSNTWWCWGFSVFVVGSMFLKRWCWWSAMENYLWCSVISEISKCDNPKRNWSVSLITKPCNNILTSR